MGGWAQSTIGEVCEVVAGQSPKGKYYNDEGNGLPFYQGKKRFCEKFLGPPEKWTTEITREAVAGDILISVRAPVGPINFATERICIGRGLAAIRVGEQLDRGFLFYAILEKQDEISGTEGAVYPSINKTQIENIDIPLPSLPEQERIVAILDEAFAAIATATANAEKNLANARELFESHLDAVFTKSGEGWPMVSLAELATEVTDGDHLPPPKSESGIPFITISNIDKELLTVDFTDTFKVPVEYYRSLKESRKPRRGDVLYTVTGSYGIPVVVADDREFCFQRHIGLIRPGEDIDPRLLFYLFLSGDLKRQADACATGTAQKTVSLKGLRRFLVPKIPLAEQAALLAKLEEVSGETRILKEVYKKKASALADLKQSVLHRAFTGELTAEPNAADRALTEAGV